MARKHTKVYQRYYTPNPQSNGGKVSEYIWYYRIGTKEFGGFKTKEEAETSLLLHFIRKHF